jgi:hypothetical protein
MTYTETLQSFTLQDLPNLDVVTLGALELFTQTQPPKIDCKRFNRPLVVGSGNAAITGKLLFDDVDAIFADETNYIHKLDTFSTIDGAYVLSASGSKHAVGIAQTLRDRGIPCILLTNNLEAPAREWTTETFVFPKNREPYTYNTSTYLGMLLSKTHEDPSQILQFITNEIESRIPGNLAEHQAFYLLLPERFALLREMFVTKFDELFGPRVMGRIFTYEQTKHAKTVIPLESELFISFGVNNELFGNESQRVSLPLPENANYGAMMAVGYYVIGQIQKQLPPFYKERIVAYTQETSSAFGSTINPIVE